ncbi:MAG: ferritin-like domain-containing protein [Myxococcales bacterium]|nr:ferritin-like domain-containing protein [Myxococcales bacterium]
MGIAGFGKTELRYDMFDFVRNAAEAKRLVKCEGIYHRGQELAWDGKDILAMLIEKHGGIHVAPEKKEALKRVFAIILWGELAAWKVSAQLADGLVPLEAKMAATGQAFDEARHFYVMHDYLLHLGYVPERLDRAPQALLDLVLDTDNLAYKLLGMQLMIETLALTVFQTVRETEVEPVLCELMRYYERDEARHVGLGMQYLPSLIQRMSKREVHQLITFQVRLLAWALWELKVLAPDFAILGIDPREVIDRGRKKQLAALYEAFNALGWAWQADRNYPAAVLKSIVEFTFPTDASRKDKRRMFANAWEVFWNKDEIHTATEFAVHDGHRIRTARGVEV